MLNRFWNDKFGWVCLTEKRMGRLYPITMTDRKKLKSVGLLKNHSYLIESELDSALEILSKSGLGLETTEMEVPNESK